MDKQIVVTVKRRSTIDLDKLARALLDVVSTLEPDEQEKLAKEGELVLKRIKERARSNRPRKRSAA